jgi:hypothetical protein
LNCELKLVVNRRVGVCVDKDAVEYFRRREQAERAAAKSASCEVARRVHQELAQHYAELLRSR